MYVRVLYVYAYVRMCRIANCETDSVVDTATKARDEWSFWVPN